MTDNVPVHLLDALAARDGIVCAVGAGGKKTTLYRLLAAHPGRVGLTATAMLTPPPRRLLDTRLVDSPEALATAVPEAAAVHRRVGFACPSSKSGRLAGLPPATVARIHADAGFAATLVKADGARMRGIKAPRHDEPLLVPGCTTIIFVVSAGVIGQPLDEHTAHRLPELTAVLDLAPGERITPRHVGRLLSHPAGARQQASGTRLVALINQVDDGERLHAARDAAACALAADTPPERIVLGAMTADDPVVEIVEPTRMPAH